MHSFVMHSFAERPVTKKLPQWMVVVESGMIILLCVVKPTNLIVLPLGRPRLAG
jgi:hypothetical protein